MSYFKKYQKYKNKYLTLVHNAGSTSRPSLITPNVSQPHWSEYTNYQDKEYCSRFHEKPIKCWNIDGCIYYPGNDQCRKKSLIKRKGRESIVDRFSRDREDWGKKKKIMLQEIIIRNELIYLYNPL